jgi:hypothetical protein
MFEGKAVRRANGSPEAIAPRRQRYVSTARIYARSALTLFSAQTQPGHRAVSVRLCVKHK